MYSAGPARRAACIAVVVSVIRRRCLQRRSQASPGQHLQARRKPRASAVAGLAGVAETAMA
jgi:hypothetical protein